MTATQNTDDGQELLPEDTIVRPTRELTEDEKAWAHFPSHARPRDERYTIDEAFPASAEPGEPDVAIYECRDEHGCTVVLPASAVEVVMTAAKAQARKLPTPETILSELDLLGDFDTFETDMSDRDGANAREVYGRTHEGLTFGFRVRVVEVWETDL